MQYTQLSRRSAGVKSSDIDWEKQYLTFIPVQDAKFSWEQRAVSGHLEYSVNEGKTWRTFTYSNSTPTIKAGSKIIWRGDLIPSTTTTGGIGTFSASANYNAYGNIMSLLFYDNYYGSQLNADNYESVFTNLFINDTHIITAPELPATTLAPYCYGQMFRGCTSLVAAPSRLPATTLQLNCYVYMFFDCTSLVKAPELPATTLRTYCYGDMFRGCTSLTTAPELPATELESNCYINMFRGCTKLNYLKALFTTTPSIDYTQSWVSGVAATGTFVKNSAATWTTTGVNGIPEGWTVVDDNS